MTGVVEGLLLSIQHAANPLHVYCRLRDKGLDRQVSMLLSRHYETVVYRFLLVATRFGITLCRTSRPRLNETP